MVKPVGELAEIPKHGQPAVLATVVNHQFNRAALLLCLAWNLWDWSSVTSVSASPW